MSSRADHKVDESNSPRVSDRPFGLPDDAFAQKRPNKGLITKAEVRAVSLYHMRIRRDSVIWDVGAGSGSVALEAAVIAHDGKAYAVERDEESLEIIRRNVANLGPQNVEIVRGEAPDALRGLPTPDSVFVGGSGGHLVDILEYAVSRINASARIVVNLVTIERAVDALNHLRSLGMRTDIITVSASRGKRMPDGGTRLEALNPVFIVIACKEGLS